MTKLGSSRISQEGLQHRFAELAAGCIKEKNSWNRSHVVTCWQQPPPEVS
jgi:hypothetical protein